MQKHCKHAHVQSKKKKQCSSSTCLKSFCFISLKFNYKTEFFLRLVMISFLVFLSLRTYTEHLKKKSLVFLIFFCFTVYKSQNFHVDLFCLHFKWLFMIYEGAKFIQNIHTHTRECIAHTKDYKTYNF